jgi:chemotaxis protein methyltransferase CheR
VTGRHATGELATLRPLDDDEFAELSDLLAAKTGLLYPPQKRRDLDAKLMTLFETMTAEERDGFVPRVRSSDAGLQSLVNRLTIGESYFFRNRPHFNALTADVIPRLMEDNAASRTIRIWSAGCAGGEEPYSIAILLKERFPELAGWNVRIMATDINTGFLERAKEAVYTRWSFRGVEERIVEKYFRPEGASHLRLSPEIARTVEYGWFNLSQLPFVGRIAAEQFDLVICRNVLIYFSFEFANRVVRALAETIRRGGYLVVGHAEAFPALRELESVYSNATYYYCRPRTDEPRAFEATLAHTVSIPGIAVHDVARRPSIPPPPARGRPAAERGATAAHAGKAAPAQPTVEQDNLELDLEAAQEHTDMGELDSALAILDRLVKGPGKLDHRVHFLRAIVADQHDRTQDAISSLKQAIFIRKEFAIGHYYMGVICEREGDRKAAKRCLRNVLETTARLPEDWVLEEGGGITAQMLRDIAAERNRELELEQ